MLLALSEYVAPLEKPSLLHPSLVAGGLSSLRFGYYGIHWRVRLMLDWNLTSNDVLPTNNTPAGDYWTLWLIYEPQNSTPPMEYAIPITFLPTGEIDTTRTSEQDMSRANSILAPTIQILQSVIPGFDFWKLANWIFVSWYWMILYDFGQIGPTVHLYRQGITRWGVRYRFPIQPPRQYFTLQLTIFSSTTLYFKFILHIC